MAVLGLLALIFDSATAIRGVNEGIRLCLQSVFPSLFLFIFLSNILISSIAFWTSAAPRRKNTPFNISSGRIGLLVIGYLGGYPVGAQSIAQAYRNHQLSRPTAQRLVICLNNPGPAFIFGITASVFSKKWISWVLWAIHILSSLLLFWLLSSDSEISNEHSSYIKAETTAALPRTLRTMALICGWVILFRTIICILQRWCLWLLPNEWKIIVCGLLEMTNGCLSLKEIDCTGLRFCLCALFLSFGGMCTVIQTYAVSEGLSCRRYLPAKMLEGVCSFILAYLIQLLLFSGNQQFRLPSLLPVIVIGIVLIGTTFFRKRKNNSRILSAVSV